MTVMKEIWSTRGMSRHRCELELGRRASVCDDRVATDRAWREMAEAEETVWLEFPEPDIGLRLTWMRGGKLNDEADMEMEKDSTGPGNWTLLVTEVRLAEHVALRMHVHGQ